MLACWRVDKAVLDIIIVDGVDGTKEVNDNAIDSGDDWAASVEEERPVKARKFGNSKNNVEGETKKTN